MQYGISKIYYNHKSRTQNAQGVVPYYTLNNLHIATDTWPCLINSITIKKHGMDQTMDKKIVRASEIDLTQPN